MRPIPRNNKGQIQGIMSMCTKSDIKTIGLGVELLNQGQIGLTTCIIIKD